jgi:SnoaL-like domain
MMIHTEITPIEQADRLAIRELIDAYAHRADRRDAEGQKALFTENTHFVVYLDGQGSEPTQVLDGREALTPVFEELNRYEATQHFNGQSTVELREDRATGETYCMAHHLFTEGGARKLMRAHLRYDDTLRQARRRLVVRGAEPVRRLDRDSGVAALAQSGRPSDNRALDERSQRPA